MKARHMQLEDVSTLKILGHLYKRLETGLLYVTVASLLTYLIVRG